MAQWGASRSRAGLWAVRALGVLILLVGLVLTAGGVWLAVLRGSLYYVLTGLALIASSILPIRRRLSGALLCGTTCLAT